MIAAAASGFLMVGAGAAFTAAITSNNGELGVASVDANCQSGAITATPGYGYDPTLPGYRLDSVVLSGLSSGCLNKNVRVVLADSSGTSVATGSGTTPGSGTTATISISPGFDMTSTFPAQLTVAVFS